MQLLSGQMRYMSARQKVLAQNIANIDTPSYRASDIKRPDFAKLVASETRANGLRTTSPKHFSGASGGNTTFKAEPVTKPFEISPTGNGVVLEEQMAKVGETGLQYEMASSIYRKFTQLYRAALGAK